MDRSLRRLIPILLLGLLAAGATSAAPPLPQGMNGVHPVPRSSSPVEIDGAMIEPAWDTALKLELDYEVRPGENIKPPVKTECYVMYDDSHVYFGFRAHDPEPEKILARYSDRDNAWSDDWVGVVLDTFNDQRRAYELFSNPLGVQIDAINDDVNGRYDSSWDAIWRSRGRITESGYEVEIAIPFNQIRFQAGDGEQVWGFDAIRSYPRGDRHHIGLFPRDRGNNSYLSQTVKLVGMQGASPGRNLEIIPTLTAGRTEARSSLPDGPFETTASDAEIGASVRWGITPNISLNGAVNPDFSQVEADAVQLDVNRTFALFFPETRPFFLEGADYFTSDINLVHTRTVEDPAGAAKITGKTGSHTFGVFAGQDASTNLIIPGAERSGFVSRPSLDADVAVGRYRYDFGKSSTVGAIVTHQSAGGYSNTVTGLDTRYRITDEDTLSFSWASSQTDYGAELVQSEGLPAGSLRDDAISAGYNHSTRTWSARASYSSFGDRFRADLGFVPQVDYDQWIVGGSRTWHGTEDTWYNEIHLGGDVDETKTQSGQLLEREWEYWLGFQLPRESFFWQGAGVRKRTFAGVEFDQQYAWIDYGIRPSGSFRFNINIDYGDAIDFANVRAGQRWSFNGGMTINGGKHFLLRFSHLHTFLDVPGGNLFTADIPQATVIHQFNTRSFIRAILQYTRITRDPSLHSTAVDEKTEDFLAQLLFSYKLNPQTALYFGYTDALLGTQDFSLTETQRSVFLKIGYAWVM